MENAIYCGKDLYTMESSINYENPTHCREPYTLWKTLYTWKKPYRLWVKLCNMVNPIYYRKPYTLWKNIYVTENPIHYGKTYTLWIVLHTIWRSLKFSEKQVGNCFENMAWFQFHTEYSSETHDFEEKEMRDNTLVKWKDFVPHVKIRHYSEKRPDRQGPWRRCRDRIFHCYFTWIELMSRYGSTHAHNQWDKFNHKKPETTV